MRDAAQRKLPYPAGLAVVVIVPIYFIYQSLAQLGLLAPVLKGFFTAGMVVTLPLLLFAAFTEFKIAGFLRRSTFLLFLGFMLVFFSLLIFSAFSDVNSDISYYVQLSFFRFIYMFLLALALMRMGQGFAHFVYYFVVCYSVFVIMTSSGGFVKPPIWYGAYLFEFDYQQVAFFYLILSMVLLPSLGAYRRYFYYIVVVPALYLIGARSEFFAFFLMVVIVEAVKNWRLMGLVSVLAVLAGGAALAIIDASILKEFRMFSVFFDGADMSMDARTTYAANAYSMIATNPIMGGFGSHPPGEYVHNLLAAWVDMGVVGFIVYLTMLICPLCGLLLVRLDEYAKPDWLRAFCFVSVTWFLLIFAKTYTYGLVPMMVAVYCVYRNGATSEALKSKLDL